MTMIADILLAAGALGAALYCYVLSRRLRRFTDLEKGVGGAVAVLSVQVDELTEILTKAQTSAKESVTQLDAVSARAEVAHKKLELSIASLHDVPEKAAPSIAASPFFVRRSADAEAK
ncbi:hypothetical protein [Roseobacter sp. CCS2]|uniref:hypothetical protein n=1 Tax=Roseobacter sp. CCS2 TaxID=391593 RepID=UPI0000F402B1|nr:hypothetical protein [Roseobacter sp. CCS2]EBA13848.1 hypothetical protein RCCS2_08164 [Roseobacter sp. CCS2]